MWVKNILNFDLKIKILIFILSKIYRDQNNHEHFIHYFYLVQERKQHAFHEPSGPEKNKYTMR